MRFVLASNSPRRRELLNNLGVSFTISASSIDEALDGTAIPHEEAKRLAFEKARDIASRIDEKAIVIAADTIVVSDRILGKPTDETDAYQMLKILSGRAHKVITGITLIDTSTGKTVVDFSETTVFFKTLSDDEIWDYIASGEPMDKAGAYGIQGKAALFVEKIEGDYYNVVGMPLFRLQELLNKHFNISLLK